MIYNEKRFLIPESINSCALYHAKIKEDGEYMFRIHDCNGGIRLRGNLNNPIEVQEAIDKLIALAEGALKFAEHIEAMYPCQGDSVHVFICDKPVWLDLHNLRDKDRAWMREPDDHPDIHPDEHYFPQDLAIKAAEMQGKRPLTREEQKYIASLPRRWDDEKKGIWITFNKVEGGTIEIFFPASGYRHRDNGAFSTVGANGYSWSASVSGTNGFTLAFNNTNVYPQFASSRATGRPVRCLSEL